MTTTADTIRCANDLALFETLKQTRDVQRVNDWIEKQDNEGIKGTRRHLLTSSVRLSKRMAPEIHKMADDCIEKLSMEIPLELYVYSSPQFNAACFKPEDGRLFVMFSSSLIEGFTPTELKYVMGHEFGHHVYRHHDIPIGYLLNGKQRPDPKLALQLFAWSRYAEISADRAGAHCAQDMNAVASSLFKLSSGLTSSVVKFSLDDFMTQIEDIKRGDAEPGQGSPQQDWFSTHPFSPLRVQALKLFEDSELANGKQSQQDLELGVQGLMSLMEPSYLEGKTDSSESMRRLLFAGSICVADASNGISQKELTVFESFFGEKSLDENLDLEKIKSSLDKRIESAKEQASVSQCMQVLHDLCLVAKADGKVTKAEKKVLSKIAAALDIPATFVNQALEMKTDLD